MNTITSNKSTIADALKRSLVVPVSDSTSNALPTGTNSIGFSGHAIVIANIGFLLPATQIEEVTGNLRFCDLPHTARWFWGMTNVRGNLLPVFDFSDLLGFGESDRKNNHVVILRNSDEVFGIVVADIPARVNLVSENELDRLPPLPEPLQGYVRKSYSKDGHIWIEWQIEEFMQSIAT